MLTNKLTLKNNLVIDVSLFESKKTKEKMLYFYSQACYTHQHKKIQCSTFIIFNKLKIHLHSMWHIFTSTISLLYVYYNTSEKPSKMHQEFETKLFFGIFFLVCDKNSTLTCLIVIQNIMNVLTFCCKVLLRLNRLTVYYLLNFI